MKYFLLTTIALFLLSAPGISQDYVGPEKCLQCHNNSSLGDMTGWRTSMHANGYSDVTDDSKTMQVPYGVVNDYDQNGIDDFHDGLNFNDVSGTVFDVFKPNAPILAYSAEKGYTITIGDITSRVYLTYGGSGLYKQRYVMRIPDVNGVESADLYISPIQYNEKTHEYVLYHASDYWVYDNGTPTNVPIFTNASTLADISTNSRSMTKGCAGCHTTGLVVNEKDANGEWTMQGGAIDPTTAAMYTDNNTFDFDGDGIKEQMNNGCETCHGAGGDHAAAPTKDNITNPETDLTPEQATNMCGMCHSRGKSLPNNTFSFAYHDDTMENWSLGELVADVYSDGGGYYGDNVDESEKRSSKKHHQQFRDFMESAKPTFQFHQVTCFECHDVHNSEKHQMRTEIIEEDSLGVEITIATDNDNNTLCLSCHATHGDFEAIPVEWIADYETNKAQIAEIVSAHTNHPYDPDGPTSASRCSKCHNPKTVKSAINYDIHSHTFEVIPPEKTKLYAMPNACAASCHMKDGLSFGIDFAGDNLGSWDEASDVALADSLMKYYGPGGKWWDHSVTAIDITENEMPSKFSLSQNYPNPFNPSTNIVFELPKASNVSLKVYNVTGQLITTLIDDEAMPAGKKLLQFDASNLAAGVYFYTITTDIFTDSKKMVLIK
jgi:type IX secretion system substrate protein